MTATIMPAGIIAAGEGSRLRSSHPSLVKPLVPIGGAPLCHWVARSLRHAEIRDLTVLINSRGRSVRRSLEQAFPDLAWRFIKRDTASSWESFRLVSLALARQARRFVISTVDALIPPRELARFLRAAEARPCEAALALTSFADDEKPLWADVDARGAVTALGNRARRKTCVTAGLYYMTRALALRMPRPSRFDRLRDYWASLVEEGAKVRGIPLSKTLDVDRPEDLPEAENFVKEKMLWQ